MTETDKEIVDEPCENCGRTEGVAADDDGYLLCESCRQPESE